jgi:hypothetical protein
MVRAKTLKAPKRSEMIPFTYNIAFGDGTAARPGMVMLRLERDGRIMHEEHMPIDQFLNLAKAFEDVARGLRNVIDGRPVG